MTAEPRVLSGRYRVDELIGRGGMATVFRGYDLTLGRQVAIKVLNRDLANDNSFRTRFRLEAQAASRMAHPTIVRVFDAGEDSETSPDGTVHPIPYIVMELVHGALLKDVHRRRSGAGDRRRPLCRRHPAKHWSTRTAPGSSTVTSSPATSW